MRHNLLAPARLRQILSLGVGLAFFLTVVPLIGFMSGSRYWPGFFYAPFYTTNIFTDASTPAGRAGLRPEYRVVAVNRQLMENLYPLTAVTGAAGEPLVLLWEVGPGQLDFLPVPVEKLDWWRVLEKYGPLLASGGLLAWWGWRRQWTASLGGLFGLAAADYWFNPGAGRLSGLDPAAWLASGQGWLASSKWSVFLYTPLSAALWAAWCLQLLPEIEAKRTRQFGVALCLALLVGELAAYSYDALKTATYNNPNFVIFHARTIFWGWLAPLGLAVWGLLRHPRRARYWLRLAGLLLFVAGYLAQTTFDRAVVPFIGAHWFVAGLVLTVWASTGKPTNSSDNFPVVNTEVLGDLG